jgi:hypothetical protein
MALVERCRRHSQLGKVAGDDGGALAETGIDHRLNARGVLDLGQLRRHVGVARTVGLVGNDLDTVARRDLEALRPHRGAKTVGTRNHCNPGEAPKLEVFEDLLASHPVGVGRLEHVFAHGVDDLDAARERNERHLGVLEYGNHRHRRAGGRAAYHGDHPVILKQTRREGARLVGVAAVVVDDQFDLLAGDAARGVDLVDIQFQRLVLGVPQEGRGPRDRKHRSDLDRFRRSGRTANGNPEDRNAKQAADDTSVQQIHILHFRETLPYRGPLDAAPYC